MSITYTILKNPGSVCGLPTDYRLNILADPGLSYSAHEVLQTSGGYVTEIRIDYEELGTGAPETIFLCDAPGVCLPDSVVLTITTNVISDPTKTKTDTDDYNTAQVGGGHRAKSSA